MTGTIQIKKLNRNSKCFVSESDYDERLCGQFWLVLEPFGFFDGPGFYWRRNSDGSYYVEGEGYIVNNKNRVDELRKDILKRHRGKTVIWKEIDERGNLIKV